MDSSRRTSCYYWSTSLVLFLSLSWILWFLPLAQSVRDIGKRWYHGYTLTPVSTSSIIYTMIDRFAHGIYHIADVIHEWAVGWRG